MKHGLRLKIGRLAVAGAAFAAGLSVPGTAQAPGLVVLDGLAKGEWTIKSRDGTIDRRVCVRTGRELIQLKHGGPECSRYVVEDSAGEVTVQYTCTGDGYGRTNIRKETASLVQLRSQGISGGLPFQFQAEARRTGSCR